METKRGAKNWVHCVLTHNQLPFCVFLEVPPDFANGPVVTVRCLSKPKLDFLSFLFFLARSN